MISGMLLTVTRILFLFILSCSASHRLRSSQTSVFCWHEASMFALSLRTLLDFCRKHQQNHQSSLCRAAWVNFTWSWQVIFQLHTLVPNALKSSSCLLLTAQKTQMVKSWSTKVQIDCRTAAAKHAETKKRVKNRHDKIQKTVWKWKMW